MIRRSAISVVYDVNRGELDTNDPEMHKIITDGVGERPRKKPVIARIAMMP